MASLGVTILYDDATPALDAIASQDVISDAEALAAAAQAMQEIYRTWFFDKEAGAHPSAASLGASPTHLFAKFADATLGTVNGNLVLLTVNHPAARQLWNGGDIFPVSPRKNLAIPARTEAYGKTPREFAEGELEPVFGRNGVYALALVKDMRLRSNRLVERQRKLKVAMGGEELELLGKKKMAVSNKRVKVEAGMILFWLVKHVHQEGDETVLPPSDRVLDGVTEAISGMGFDDIVSKGNRKAGKK